MIKYACTDAEFVAYIHEYTTFETISSLMDELEASPFPYAYGRYEDRVMSLMSLSVPRPLRNRGVGTALLRGVALGCLRLGLRRIDLDDMSDRFGQKNNIYVKFGFRYRQPGFPEMYSSVHRAIGVRTPLELLQRVPF